MSKSSKQLIEAMAESIKDAYNESGPVNSDHRQAAEFALEALKNYLHVEPNSEELYAETNDANIRAYVELCREEQENELKPAQLFGEGFRNGYMYGREIC